MKAEVIAHSVTDLSIEMVTWELECPRFIWAEMLTHGRLSKNASSSRAIPNKRLTQDILDHTAMPVFWGGNKPGMQTGEEIDAQVQDPITGEMLSREDAPVAFCSTTLGTAPCGARHALWCCLCDLRTV